MSVNRKDREFGFFVNKNFQIQFLFLNFTPNSFKVATFLPRPAPPVTDLKFENNESL